MQSFDEKYFNKLVECKFCDRTNVLYVTKWNANFGASYITTYGNDMFITPYGYGDCTKKTIKINKNEISRMSVKKSFLLGSKFIIELKNGTILKYKIVNISWIDDANALIDWLKK